MRDILQGKVLKKKKEKEKINGMREKRGGGGSGVWPNKRD